MIATHAWAFTALSALAQQAVVDPSVVVEGLSKQMTPAVAAWLASGDPRTQAWGAYLAVRDGRTETIPALLDLLAHYSVTPGLPATDAHDAMIETLDAIIQLGAEAPVEDAQRIYPEFPVQSMILLARAKQDASKELLSIFKTEQRMPAAWLAAGNLLAHKGAQGFAAAVISDMTVHARVIVVDPHPGYGVGFGSDVGAGQSPQSPKTGWPPVGLYTFGGCGSNSRTADTILAPGVDVATYRRIVSAGYAVEPDDNCAIDRDLVREHYLTGMLSASGDEPPIRAHVGRTIEWQGADAYLRDFNGFVNEQQARFDDVAHRLAVMGRITDEEAKSLRPALEITIEDHHSDGTPLPPAGPFAANVRTTGR